MKNKKFIAMGLMTATFLSMLTGCGQRNGEVNESEKPKVEESTSKKQGTTPVKVSEIELVDFVLTSEDSYGDCELKAKFKNNSNENITSITYTYEMNGEKVYLSTYETLLPGDISTLESTYVQGGNPDDLKLLSVNIEVVKEDGTEISIEYDAKLDKYRMFEY